MKPSLLLALIAPASLFAQGSLTPPGAPAPTMKSLDQVEARIPVSAANTPGDSSNQFIISKAGSYYLTGNIAGQSAYNGINITADSVTLNLNGYSMIGGSGSRTGINITGNNAVILNGAITSWGQRGIYFPQSVGTTQAARIERIVVSSNGLDGIYGFVCGQVTDCVASLNGGVGIGMTNAGQITRCLMIHNTSNGLYVQFNAVVVDCTASYNNGVGIQAGAGSTLTGCTCTSNPAFGIQTGDGCTLTNCACDANQSGGIPSGGIETGNNCALLNCSASSNTTSASGGTAGAGFVLGSNCSASRCTASGNNGDGFNFGSRCSISDNNAASNGNAGFRASGTLNRIDGNSACANGAGGIVWSNDFVVRNVAFNNAGSNYSPAVGTGNTGPVQAAGSATNPWANF